jgi:hypothetical protein
MVVSTELSREDELCLLLARGKQSDSTRTRIQALLPTEVEWKKLWRRADEHQVLPLVYRSLLALEFQNVPGDFKSKLSTEFRLNAVRSMLFLEELARIVRVLTRAGIRVMPLKGPLLAEELYNDPAFRTSSDLDIMVEPGNAIRARQVLLEDGYNSPFSNHFFEKYQFRTSADCPLRVERGNFPYLLELHWTMVQHSSKDQEATNDCWQDATARTKFDSEIFQMSPEWEFLYLACHAASHKWQTLKWIADINDCCLIKPINWASVAQKAERLGLGFTVESTLAVCAYLYGLSIPPEFSSASLPPGVRLFPDSLSLDVAWKAPLFNRRLLKSPLEKFYWYMEMIFIARPADEMAFHLPDSFDFLYFVLRPLRLVFKYARLAARARGSRPRE